MSRIVKFLNPSGPIIKRSKDGYRYIPDEKGGWSRITDDAMSNVFSTLEITPNGLYKGSPITRVLLKPLSTYASTYNPGDVVKGFNILTLGGLNNLSPTQWGRRAYDAGKFIKGDMTWNGFVDSWVNGNNGVVSLKFSEEHPYYSAALNLSGDLVAGTGALLNKSFKPLNVYDALAPKTNRLLYDGSKLLTPRAKYFRDRLFFNKEYLKARKAGQYPLTFSERRQYLTDLHNDYQGVRDRLLYRRGEDYYVRHPYYNVPKGGLLYDSPEEYIKGLDYIVPKDISITSLEGNPNFIKTASTGYYEPLGSKIYTSVRKRNSLLPSGSREEIRGLQAHEADHAVLNYLGDFAELEESPTLVELRLIEDRGYKPYHVALNRNSYMFNDYAPITEQYRGSWFGSPNEVNSEMQNILELIGTTKSYRDLKPGSPEKYRVNKFMEDRFGIPLGHPALLEISKKGFFKKGGKTNMIEFLKKGSGIHIKPSQRGSFTKYCGGNVTNECILRGKNSSDSKIRKKATFAANARKWKHLDGGKVRKGLIQELISNEEEK